ncbi:hypothetical protein DY000_02051532 [Brassica cretica]|uniref:MYB-CC type transcription factor LHEQLE-containing domain-containing protein n=1 Tax=Brassica cretica TaxID=69181 RepID=A0ABQ7F6K6_BRACR|nr:hypothetical protein DY000_02051532 [Brassica cretica]
MARISRLAADTLMPSAFLQQATSRSFNFLFSIFKGSPFFFENLMSSTSTSREEQNASTLLKTPTSATIHESLRKYRLSKNLNGQANSGLNKIDSNQVNIIDQVQRHLQLRIEAQGKYLQSVLEKAQETLGRQNLSPAGIEAAKVQLSELVSKVSAEYPNTSFLDSKEFQNLCPQQMQTAYPQDSCLTSSEGAQKNPKMLGLRTYLGDSTSEQKEVIEEPLFQRMELTWTEGLRGNPYLSTMVSDAEQRISLGVGMHGHRGHQQGNNAYNKEERFNDKSEDHKLETQSTKTELDLNTHVENYCTTRPKQFDLNGFSWN